MDVKNFVGLLVFGLVGVLVLSAFIPIITETTSATDTLENDGYFHMEKYGTDTDITIVWDPSDAKKITVNGVTYSPNTPVNQFVNVAIGDDWYFRYADGGANTYVQVSYDGLNQVVGSNSDNQTVTVTCSNGSATITKGATTQTMDYTELYVISGDEGKYVMKNATESVYMAANTEFTALGTTAIGEGRAVLKIVGDVGNGATVEVIASNPVGATISDIEVNATALTDYRGYSLTTVTFTITADEVDYPATYSYFIVPSEVTLERSFHMDSTLATVINLLPFIAGIGLLLFFVGEFLINRYL